MLLSALVLVGPIAAGLPPSSSAFPTVVSGQSSGVASDAGHWAAAPTGVLQQLTIPAKLDSGPIAIEVELDGVKVALELERRSMRAPGFQLLVTTPGGALVSMPAPQPRTWRGTIDGRAGTHVSASISERGFVAVVDDRQSGRLWQIQPAAGAADGIYSVAREFDLPADGTACGTLDAVAQDPTAGTFDRGTGLRLCELALDTDHEFFLANGSSITACVDDMESVINRVDMIYRTDVDVTFQLTAIVVRADPADPYDSSSSSGALNEFRADWNTTKSFIRRDIAHMFSGRPANGINGIAFLNTLCGGSAFGLNRRVGASLTSRAATVSHELGHGFGSGHCNSLSDCRIMCSGQGGCSNDITQFGVPVQNIIGGNAQSSSCLIDLAPPIALPLTDLVGTVIDSSKWISNQGVVVSTNAVAEPSPGRSLQFNAVSAAADADDVLISNKLLLAGATSTQVRFQSQARGVPVGGAIRIDVTDATGTWLLVGRVESDGTTQDVFTSHAFALPAGGLHDDAQIRFVAEVDAPSETWYIDDIEVTDLQCDEVSSFCLGFANTTGQVGELGYSGSTSVFANQLTLLASKLPPQQFGLLVYGDTPGLIGLADGLLCVVGTPIYRYAIVQIDALGDAAVPFDLTALPPGSQIGVGDTVYYQFWHRDATSNGANLTLGLSVRFCQ